MIGGAYDAYATRKLCVFMSLLKLTKQEIVFILIGSAFHIRGAETDKFMAPYRLRDGGTYKSLFVAESNTRVARCSWSRLFCKLVPVRVVHETSVAE